MNENSLRGWVKQVREGHLPRRDFMARMVSLGVGVPLASAMLSGVAHAQVGGAKEAPYKGTKRGGGGALRLLFWQGPTNLNPHFASGTKDQNAAALFYEPLARYDAEGLLVPVLAAEIPSRTNGGIAADGKSTTWKLRKDVSWHDGKPFTADDVVFNWRYATDPTTGAYSIGNYVGIKAVEKIDAHTVRYVFDAANPVWDRAVDTLLLPKHVFAAFSGAAAAQAPANQKPVGTAAYRFVSFTPGDLVRGELNPTYYLPNRPFFDTVELKGGGDAASAARAVLQTGEFDYAWNLQVEDKLLQTMEAGGKGRVVFGPTGASEFILLNAADPWTEVDGERASPKSKHPILSDPAVRQALALLVDRKSIQDFVYGRAGAATANFLNNPAVFNSPNTRQEFNLDKANAALDAAGWKRGGDGIRVKDGKRLKLVFQTSINAVRQKVQAIIKQAFGKAGIELELKAVTASVFFSSDVGNPDTFGKFWADLEMYQFTRSGTDPQRYMLQWASWEVASKANQWQGRNHARWASEDFDRAYRAAEVELDPVKRAALFIKMNDLVCGSGYTIPLVVRAEVTGVANNLTAPLSSWDLGLSALRDWSRG
jgi:peptide/nickel transport system substrate-binding protein